MMYSTSAASVLAAAGDDWASSSAWLLLEASEAGNTLTSLFRLPAPANETHHAASACDFFARQKSIIDYSSVNH